MPDLTQSLQGQDLKHLKIVAELWGIELNAPDARSGLQRLVPAMLDPQLIEEALEPLPSEARLALDDLLAHQGQLPWALFSRRYGQIQEMGPARRDREKPYRASAIPAEMLWYRALIGRAFFDSPNGPQEYAYIPADLLALLPDLGLAEAPLLGRPALPAERVEISRVTDRILDHSCTLLAGLRLNIPLGEIASDWETPVDFLLALLSAADLVDAGKIPRPEQSRAFLEASRAEALVQLACTWLNTPRINELHLLPGLRVEGEWQNDPILARQSILHFLSGVPAKSWWSLTAFIHAIRENYPDYQRPAGDYDSWFLRDESTGEFLRGHAHWNEVDGALVRYLIAGPLHWLGILDLAYPASPGIDSARLPTAFRFSRWAESLLRCESPEGLPVEEASMHASSDARLNVPRLAPRSVRYQISRFSEWDEQREDSYHYRLTPLSLERARKQGLKLAHLLTLLRKHAAAVPPSLIKALERWDDAGVQAHLQQVVVLRVASPDLLQTLRSSRAARFLGDPLGPTTIIVKNEAVQKVLLILAEMGYLGEVDFEV
jgi:hypothetical protein